MNLALIEIKANELRADVFSYTTSNSLIISSHFYKKRVLFNEAGEKDILSSFSGMRVDKVTFFSAERGVDRGKILNFSKKMREGGVVVDSFDISLEFLAKKVKTGPMIFVASAILQN